MLSQCIVEEKFPFGKHAQLSIHHTNNKPLHHAALCIIRAMKSTSNETLTNLVDQAGLLMEQSMVYYDCKQKSSQNFLVCIKIYYLNSPLYATNTLKITIIFYYLNFVSKFSKTKFALFYFDFLKIDIQKPFRSLLNSLSK